MLFSGCVEDYDLYRDEIVPRLVVEGLITNKPGPYYIRLTKSQTGSFKEPDYGYTDAAIAVKDAQIIISDNINQIDTLIPVDVNLNEYTLDRYGYYKLLYDSIGNIIDTLFLKDPPAFNYTRGFYKTKHLIGIPGRTYFLKISSEGKKYEASAYMPPVPDIDSLKYEKKISEKDGQAYYIPLLFFDEPQETLNYYLIQLMDEISARSVSSNTLWQFSVLSDENLQPYVRGLNISLGETPRGIIYPIYHEGDSIYVAFSSLTKEAFDFYKALLAQFYNDGGAYQPSPGSPPTNINNGALGCFRASSVTEKRTKIK